jgi:hypothetical protein
VFVVPGELVVGWGFELGRVFRSVPLAASQRERTRIRPAMLLVI